MIADSTHKNPPLRHTATACGILLAACVATLRAAPAYVPGEAIVLYADDRPLARIASESAPHEAPVHRMTLLVDGRPRSCAVIRSTDRSTAALVDDLRHQDGILAVSPNFFRHALATPADPGFTMQWGLHNTGQTVEGVTGRADADIDFPEALRLQRPSPGGDIVVAVIDTGIDYGHPDLVDCLWINAGEVPGNARDDDGNGRVDDVYGYDFAGDGAGAPPDAFPLDIHENGHGTAVAGIIAATMNNTLGGAGVCERARVMTLKAAYSNGVFRTADIIAAVGYAVTMKLRGVNIVALNCSFGDDGSYSEPEAAAFRSAASAGIVICAAAGNGGGDQIGDNNDVLPVYPASYDIDGMVSVTASDPSDRLAAFANYGAESVDIAAPGTSIYSTLPRHLATEARITSGATVIAAQGMAFSGIAAGLAARLVNCGYGDVGGFPSSVAGKIALIQRGPAATPLTFAEKATHAMAAGAIGVVIYNYEPGLVHGSLVTPGPWPPVIFVSQNDGQVLVSISAGMGMTTLVNAVSDGAPYAFSDGTSMATPHVSGAVALMAAAFPSDTVTTRVRRILDSVDPVTAFAGRVTSHGRLNLAQALDTDRDTLPDWWELAFAPDLAALHAAGDFDHDLQSDRHEFLTGTAPHDASDALRVTDVEKQATTARLRWEGTVGVSYRVERASQPHGPYTPVSALIPGAPTTTCDAPLTSDASSYFRVTVTE